MAYFPFFVELEGESGLIAGGGAVALRKIEKLLPFGPSLTVTAPLICPEIAAMPGLRLCRREFSPGDLDGCRFAVAATDARDVNREISRLCMERGIPVNSVDDRDGCSFLFPALVQRGSLTVGVCTGGASPTAAAFLKDEIAAMLPPCTEELLAWLGSMRGRLELPAAHRQAAYRALFRAGLANGGPLGDAETAAVIAAASEDTV